MTTKKEMEFMRRLLDQKVNGYNNRDFIQHDPICIPHSFKKKEDIEISGFLSAIIAWGQRTSIIKSARKMMDCMDHTPYAFLLGCTDKDLLRFSRFVHRTFQSEDLMYFVHRLKEMYRNEGGLEKVFSAASVDAEGDMAKTLHNFKASFFQLPHLPRSQKHLPDPLQGSAAKRMNMFLRWMVRKDDAKVDFGIWSGIKPSDLIIPLDVHTGNVSRKLGLLHRKQNDWKAANELTLALRTFCEEDPVKYDYALFGLGVFEKVK